MIVLLACVSTEEEVIAEEKVIAEEEKVYEGISYYVALGDIESAIAEYEKAFDVNPEDPETANLYARLLMLAGENQEAREILLKIILKDSENVSAYYSLSILAGIEGNEEEQKEYLGEIIEKQPDDTDALAMLGEIQLRDDELEEARESFEQALDADSENIIAVLGMGNIMIQEKEYSNAEDYFDKAIEIFSEYSFSYVDRAYVRKNQGNYTGAIEDLTKAIELHPDFYWNYIDRGKIYLLLEYKDEAAADFESAISFDANYFLAYMYLAGIYYEFGISCYDDIEGWDWDLALEYWEYALENYKMSAFLNEEYYFVYGPMGVLNFVLDDWDEALESFVTAYEKDKKDHIYALLAALTYYKLGRDSEAANYIGAIAQTISQDTWFYEVANYLKRPSYDIPLVNYYKAEENQTIKNRILFYLASYYLIAGNERAAQTFFIDVETLGMSGMIEKILAHYELVKMGTE